MRLLTPTRIASLLIMLGISVAACGHSADQKAAEESAPASTTSASAPTGAAPAQYDISRVDNIKNDFPEGFSVESQPAKTLDQHDIDSSDVTALTGAHVDPSQCRSVLVPPYAVPSVGTEAVGVRAQGDDGNVLVVALRLPQPVPVSQPPAGCDRVSVSGSPEATGTAERIPAPSIDGVTTSGVELTANDPDEPPDYLFTAALNDRTSIVVMGSMDPDLDPQQFLSDLLVKAAAAVRGH